jgi:DNA uptake protein ComE-like DNA-binding protein
MKSRLFYFLKTFFGFTRRESRGFILIIPILTIIYSVPSVYGMWIKNKNKGDFQLYLDKVDSLRSAGFRPYEKKHFLQAKTGNQDTVNRYGFNQRSRFQEINKLDFNDADSIVLQIVPGIGATMAGRIIKFRDNIGGIHNKEQFMDVYGMTPELLERMFDFFVFKPGIIVKLPINSLDVSSLAKHPYISYGAAKVIVAYREQHGNYREANDLLKIKIFNQEWLSRLEPYLEF